MADVDEQAADDEKGQTCEKCSRWFYWPLVGAQPTRGDFVGVPLCPDCYLDEEPHRAR